MSLTEIIGDSRPWDPALEFHSCANFDLDYFGSASIRYHFKIDLPLSCDELWAVLVDPESWPQWASVIQGVTWTSDPPLGRGACTSLNRFVRADRSLASPFSAKIAAEGLGSDTASVNRAA